MLRHKLGAALCVVPAAVWLQPAQAYDLSGLKINGFGQVVVGSTLDNNRQYLNNTEPLYAYDADPKFNDESLFALQITAPVTTQISATAQIVSHGSNDYQTSFEWAYVNYQFNSDWGIKLGRQRLPDFYYSDYLEVGVAYPWIRAPSSVYQYSNYFKNFDGITLNYSHTYGNWELDPQVLYGRYETTVPIGVDSGSVLPPATVSTKNWRGGSVSALYSDWLHLRVAYMRDETSSGDALTDPLLNPLNTPGGITGTSGACCSAAYQELAFVNRRTDFGSLAAEINYGNWQVIGEFTEIRTNHSFFGDQYDSYIALGRHFGRFEAMFTWGHDNASTPSTALNYIPGSTSAEVCVGNAACYPAGTSFPVSSYNALPASEAGIAFNAPAPGSPYVTTKIPIPVAPAIAQVIAGSAAHDNFFQYDLRYDLASNVALKLDFTTYNPNKHEASFGKVSTNLLSAGVAFSF